MSHGAAEGKAERRSHVTAFCLALPEATEDGESFVGFKVRGKNFAWYADDHHGDGRVAVWCKAVPGAQESLIASGPERFFAPPYVGPKGWVALRLDGDDVDWDEVTWLIHKSYRLVAPKALAADVGVR